MHDEDIFLRSNKGFAYLCVAPCILFSAAVWFTPNSAGIVIAHTFQVYFSILLFYLSLRVWSLRDNFDRFSITPSIESIDWSVMSVSKKYDDY